MRVEGDSFNQEMRPPRANPKKNFKLFRVMQGGGTRAHQGPERVRQLFLPRVLANRAKGRKEAGTVLALMPLKAS